LKLPLFGALNLKIVLSKFAHYLSIMFGSGISILESFVIIQRVVGSEVIRLSIGRVRDGVEKGRSVYEALKDERIFPPLILRMIQVGESTGKLDVSLDKVSEYYDKEVPATIKKIFAAFEPMLVLVMGGAVLFIALSIFLPIYKLTSTIGGQR
ncbi:MAG TPA: type II secretion system F family protein, partial [Candidatus Aminicenantes bacterium]|nr:type II secretion system F family protein [Candidatus Aminicenantes bacterium]